MRRPEWAALLGACLLAAAALFAISGYRPWISPDTGGYLDPPPMPEAWARARHPLFGWMLAALPGQGFRALPALQVALFLAATAWLHRSVRGYGVSIRAAFAVTGSILLSNLLLLWHNAVHPEFPSVILALAALGSTVRLAAGGALLPNAGAAALALGGAYLLRPTFLPAILLVPALYGLLARLRLSSDTGRILARAGLLALLCAAPFLANAAVRLRAVGDFNIVSFGGFQMSGMAGLMLSPEVVGRLPDDVRPLGEAILAGREAAERRGEVLATPANSRGERSFVSAALGYYDLYARTYDSLLYGPIAALQGTEPWMRWNARLMRFSLATVRAAPERYAAWVVGGTARFVGRAIVTNLPLVLALAGCALLYPVALWLRRVPAAASGSLDVPALVLLTAIYTVAAGALSVLTTFPAARYIDTAGLLLPALPIYGLLTLGAALLARPAAEP